MRLLRHLLMVASATAVSTTSRALSTMDRIPSKDPVNPVLSDLISSIESSSGWMTMDQVGISRSMEQDRKLNRERARRRRLNTDCGDTSLDDPLFRPMLSKTEQTQLNTNLELVIKIGKDYSDVNMMFHDISQGASSDSGDYFTKLVGDGLVGLGELVNGAGQATANTACHEYYMFGPISWTNFWSSANANESDATDYCKLDSDVDGHFALCVMAVTAKTPNDCQADGIWTTCPQYMNWRWEPSIRIRFATSLTVTATKIENIDPAPAETPTINPTQINGPDQWSSYQLSQYYAIQISFDTNTCPYSGTRVGFGSQGDDGYIAANANISCPADNDDAWTKIETNIMEWFNEAATRQFSGNYEARGTIISVQKKTFSDSNAVTPIGALIIGYVGVFPTPIGGNKMTTALAHWPNSGRHSHDNNLIITNGYDFHKQLELVAGNFQVAPNDTMRDWDMPVQVTPYREKECNVDVCRTVYACYTEVDGVITELSNLVFGQGQVHATEEAACRAAVGGNWNQSGQSDVSCQARIQDASNQDYLFTNPADAISSCEPAGEQAEAKSCRYEFRSKCGNAFVVDITVEFGRLNDSDACSLETVITEVIEEESEEVGTRAHVTTQGAYGPTDPVTQLQSQTRVSFMVAHDDYLTKPMQAQDYQDRYEWLKSDGFKGSLLAKVNSCLTAPGSPQSQDNELGESTLNTICDSNSANTAYNCATCIEFEQAAKEVVSSDTGGDVVIVSANCVVTDNFPTQGSLVMIVGGMATTSTQANDIENKIKTGGYDAAIAAKLMAIINLRLAQVCSDEGAQSASCGETTDLDGDDVGTGPPGPVEEPTVEEKWSSVVTIEFQGFSLDQMEKLRDDSNGAPVKNGMLHLLNSVVQVPAVCAAYDATPNDGDATLVRCRVSIDAINTVTKQVSVRVLSKNDDMEQSNIETLVASSGFRIALESYIFANASYMTPPAPPEPPASQQPTNTGALVTIACPAGADNLVNGKCKAWVDCLADANLCIPTKAQAMAAVNTHKSAESSIGWDGVITVVSVSNNISNDGAIDVSLNINCAVGADCTTTIAQFTNVAATCLPTSDPAQVVECTQRIASDATYQNCNNNGDQVCTFTTSMVQNMCNELAKADIQGDVNSLPWDNNECDGPSAVVAAPAPPPDTDAKCQLPAWAPGPSSGTDPCATHNAGTESDCTSQENNSCIYTPEVANTDLVQMSVQISSDVFVLVNAISQSCKDSDEANTAPCNTKNSKNDFSGTDGCLQTMDGVKDFCKWLPVHPLEKFLTDTLLDAGASWASDLTITTARLYSTTLLSLGGDADSATINFRVSGPKTLKDTIQTIIGGNAFRTRCANTLLTSDAVDSSAKCKDPNGDASDPNSCDSKTEADCLVAEGIGQCVWTDGTTSPTSDEVTGDGATNSQGTVCNQGAIDAQTCKLGPSLQIVITAPTGVATPPQDTLKTVINDFFTNSPAANGSLDPPINELEFFLNFISWLASDGTTRRRLTDLEQAAVRHRLATDLAYLHRRRLGTSAETTVDVIFQLGSSLAAFSRITDPNILNQLLVYIANTLNVQVQFKTSDESNIPATWATTTLKVLDLTFPDNVTIPNLTEINVKGHITNVIQDSSSGQYNYSGIAVGNTNDIAVYVSTVGTVSQYVRRISFEIKVNPAFIGNSQFQAATTDPVNAELIDSLTAFIGDNDFTVALLGRIAAPVIVQETGGETDTTTLVVTTGKACLNPARCMGIQPADDATCASTGGSSPTSTDLEIETACAGNTLLCQFLKRGTTGAPCETHNTSPDSCDATLTSGGDQCHFDIVKLEETLIEDTIKKQLCKGMIEACNALSAVLQPDCYAAAGTSAAQKLNFMSCNFQISISNSSCQTVGDNETCTYSYIATCATQALCDGIDLHIDDHASTVDTAVSSELSSATNIVIDTGTVVSESNTIAVDTSVVVTCPTSCTPEELQEKVEAAIANSLLGAKCLSNADSTTDANCRNYNDSQNVCENNGANPRTDELGQQCKWRDALTTVGTCVKHGDTHTQDQCTARIASEDSKTVCETGGGCKYTAPDVIIEVTCTAVMDLCNPSTQGLANSYTVTSCNQLIAPPTQGDASQQAACEPGDGNCIYVNMAGKNECDYSITVTGDSAADVAIANELNAAIGDDTASDCLDSTTAPPRQSSPCKDQTIPAVCGQTVDSHGGNGNCEWRTGSLNSAIADELDQDGATQFCNAVYCKEGGTPGSKDGTCHDKYSCQGGANAGVCTADQGEAKCNEDTDSDSCGWVSDKEDGVCKTYTSAPTCNNGAVNFCLWSGSQFTVVAGEIDENTTDPDDVTTPAPVPGVVSTEQVTCLLSFGLSQELVTNADGFDDKFKAAVVVAVSYNTNDPYKPEVTAAALVSYSPATTDANNDVVVAKLTYTITVKNPDLPANAPQGTLNAEDTIKYIKELPAFQSDMRSQLTSQLLISFSQEPAPAPIFTTKQFAFEVLLDQGADAITQAVMKTKIRDALVANQVSSSPHQHPVAVTASVAIVGFQDMTADTPGKYTMTVEVTTDNSQDKDDIEQYVLDKRVDITNDTCGDSNNNNGVTCDARISNCNDIQANNDMDGVCKAMCLSGGAQGVTDDEQCLYQASRNPNHFEKTIKAGIAASYFGPIQPIDVPDSYTFTSYVTIRLDPVTTAGWGGALEQMFQSAVVAALKSFAPSDSNHALYQKYLPNPYDKYCKDDASQTANCQLMIVVVDGREGPHVTDVTFTVAMLGSQGCAAQNLAEESCVVRMYEDLLKTPAFLYGSNLVDKDGNPISKANDQYSVYYHFNDLAGFDVVEDVCNTQIECNSQTPAPAPQQLPRLDYKQSQYLTDFSFQHTNLAVTTDVNAPLKITIGFTTFTEGPYRFQTIKDVDLKTRLTINPTSQANDAMVAVEDQTCDKKANNQSSTVCSVYDTATTCTGVSDCTWKGSALSRQEQCQYGYPECSAQNWQVTIDDGASDTIKVGAWEKAAIGSWDFSDCLNVNTQNTRRWKARAYCRASGVFSEPELYELTANEIVSQCNGGRRLMEVSPNQLPQNRRRLAQKAAKCPTPENPYQMDVGLEYSGGQCNDIDECGVQNAGDLPAHARDAYAECHANAECVNIIGSRIFNACFDPETQDDYTEDYQTQLACESAVDTAGNPLSLAWNDVTKVRRGYDCKCPLTITDQTGWNGDGFNECYQCATNCWSCEGNAGKCDRRQDKDGNAIVHPTGKGLCEGQYQYNQVLTECSDHNDNFADCHLTNKASNLSKSEGANTNAGSSEGYVCVWNDEGNPAAGDWDGRTGCYQGWTYTVNETCGACRGKGACKGCDGRGKGKCDVAAYGYTLDLAKDRKPTNIDECVDYEPCTRNVVQECIDTLGGFQCKCPSGTVGNGIRLDYNEGDYAGPKTSCQSSGTLEHGEWSHWTVCDTTCGRGFRTRACGPNGAVDSQTGNNLPGTTGRAPSGYGAKPCAGPDTEYCGDPEDTCGEEIVLEFCTESDALNDANYVSYCDPNAQAPAVPTKSPRGSATKDGLDLVLEIERPSQDENDNNSINWNAIALQPRDISQDANCGDSAKGAIALIVFYDVGTDSVFHKLLGASTQTFVQNVADVDFITIANEESYTRTYDDGRPNKTVVSVTYKNYFAGANHVVSSRRRRLAEVQHQEFTFMISSGSGSAADLESNGTWTTMSDNKNIPFCGTLNKYNYRKNSWYNWPMGQNVGVQYKFVEEIYPKTNQGYGWIKTYNQAELACNDIGYQLCTTEQLVEQRQYDDGTYAATGGHQKDSMCGCGWTKGDMYSGYECAWTPPGSERPSDANTASVFTNEFVRCQASAKTVPEVKGAHCCMTICTQRWQLELSTSNWACDINASYTLKLPRECINSAPEACKPESDDRLHSGLVDQDLLFSVGAANSCAVEVAISPTASTRFVDKDGLETTSVNAMDIARFLLQVRQGDIRQAGIEIQDLTAKRVILRVQCPQGETCAKSGVRYNGYLPAPDDDVRNECYGMKACDILWVENGITVQGDYVGFNWEWKAGYYCQDQDSSKCGNGLVTEDPDGNNGASVVTLRVMPCEASDPADTQKCLHTATQVPVDGWLVEFVAKAVVAYIDVQARRRLAEVDIVGVLDDYGQPIIKSVTESKSHRELAEVQQQQSTYPVDVQTMFHVSPTVLTASDGATANTPNTSSFMGDQQTIVYTTRQVGGTEGGDDLSALVPLAVCLGGVVVFLAILGSFLCMRRRSQMPAWQQRKQMMEMHQHQKTLELNAGMNPEVPDLSAKRDWSRTATGEVLEIPEQIPLALGALVHKGVPRPESPRENYTDKERGTFAADDPSKIRGRYTFGVADNPYSPVHGGATGPTQGGAPRSPSERGRPSSPQDMLPRGSGQRMTDLDLGNKGAGLTGPEPEHLPEISVGDSSDDSQSSVVQGARGAGSGASYNNPSVAQSEA